MTILLAAGAVTAAVAAYAASLAFCKRPWAGLSLVAVFLVCLVGGSVIDTLATLPSDTLLRWFESRTSVEALAFLICLEAALAVIMLWYATSYSAKLQDTLLVLPFVVPLGTLLALAQTAMVYGPRIDLQVLGWAGLGVGLVVAAGLTLSAYHVKAKAPDFMLELCLFLRLLAVLLAAAMVSVQAHRPAPELVVEPLGMLILAVICVGLVAYGYMRRPHY